MSETFREPTPFELQQTVLQFLGQNMGELKNLDSHLISKNNTLQGMTLRPGEIMRSMPQPQVQHHPHPIPPPQPQQPIMPPQPAPVPVQILQPISNVLDPNDPVQMEFSFNQTSYAKSIFESLRDMEYTLSQQKIKLQDIENKIDQLLKVLSNKKKLEKPQS